jgi:hypothetical protein
MVRLIPFMECVQVIRLLSKRVFKSEFPLASPVG